MKLRKTRRRKILKTSSGIDFRSLMRPVGKAKKSKKTKKSQEPQPDSETTHLAPAAAPSRPTTADLAGLWR